MSDDLPALLTDASTLDALSDPATSIILSLERSKEWLAIALASNDIDQILEIKAAGEAARVYTIAKQLGKDAELAACEIVRRAERGLGLAIRKGQTEGRIRTQGSNGRGRPIDVDNVDIYSVSEACGMPLSTVSAGAYALTDGIDDGTFEAVIAEAKAERNLSQRNVKRKLRGASKPGRWDGLAELAAQGHTSSQIAQELDSRADTVVRKARELGIDIPADRVLSGTRHINQNRILTEMVAALEAIAPSSDLIRVDRINSDVLADCLARMDDAMRTLNRLRKRLKRGGCDGSE